MDEIKKAERPSDDKSKIKKKKSKEEKVVKENPLDKLSPVHREFCMAYVENLGNGTRAYMSAFPKVKETSARTEASKLLVKPNIRDAIQHLYSLLWAKRTDDLEKSKTYNLIHCIGDSDIADVIDLEHGTLAVKSLSEIPAKAVKAIQSIEFTEKTTAHGMDRNIKVRMHDKLSALKLRAQLQGMIEEKVENNIEITIRPAEKPEE